MILTGISAFNRILFTRLQHESYLLCILPNYKSIAFLNVIHSYRKCFVDYKKVNKLVTLLCVTTMKFLTLNILSSIRITSKASSNFNDIFYLLNGIRKINLQQLSKTLPDHLPDSYLAANNLQNLDKNIERFERLLETDNFKRYVRVLNYSGFLIT